MGASLTFGSTTSDYASAAAQSKYGSGSLTELSLKMRVKGDIWTPNYQVVQLFSLPNRDSFYVYALRQDSTYQIGINSGNTGADTYTIASFTGSGSSYYVLYFQYFATGNGGRLSAIADSTGTLIAAQSAQGNGTLGGTTGAVEVGKQPTTGCAWTVDGIAVYSTVLSGASRFSTPAAGDTGLVALYKFDDGSGSSVVDTTGGTSLTLAGSNTWNAGDGAWDPAATSAPFRGINTGLIY